MQSVMYSRGQTALNAHMSWCAFVKRDEWRPLGHSSLSFPVSHIGVLVGVLVPPLLTHLPATVPDNDSADNDSGAWVPAFPLGDPQGVPGSWLQLHPL